MPNDIPLVQNLTWHVANSVGAQHLPTARLGDENKRIENKEWVAGLTGYRHDRINVRRAEY
jgi:hypothetical protein